MYEPSRPATPSDATPSDAGLDAAAYDRGFAVADLLAAHGAECVCPRCAGRLPGLLSELARALSAGGSRSA